MYLYSPIAAGLAGAVAGGLAVAPTVGGIPRWAQAGLVGIIAICWGVVYALAAWLWPPEVPAYGFHLLRVVPGTRLSLKIVSGDRIKSDLIVSFIHRREIPHIDVSSATP